MAPSPQQVTQLLVAWSGGDQAARDELMPLVYEELRRLAHQCMRRERPAHTLQTSALLNEAYLRLVDQKNSAWAVWRFISRGGTFRRRNGGT